MMSLLSALKTKNKTQIKNSITNEKQESIKSPRTTDSCFLCISLIFFLFSALEKTIFNRKRLLYRNLFDYKDGLVYSFKSQSIALCPLSSKKALAFEKYCPP